MCVTVHGSAGGLRDLARAMSRLPCHTHAVHAEMPSLVAATQVTACCAVLPCIAPSIAMPPGAACKCTLMAQWRCTWLQALDAAVLLTWPLSLPWLMICSTGMSTLRATPCTTSSAPGLTRAASSSSEASASMGASTLVRSG